MKFTTTVALATASVLIMGTMTTVRAQSGFEAEPVLKATDLVTPELLKGPHFTVDPKVPTAPSTPTAYTCSRSG